ncbi:MAG: M28 family peptidase [Bryobacterales bacterium]|nr:M28 family peptidase [Bryobacterales bacterium]
MASPLWLVLMLMVDRLPAQGVRVELKTLTPGLLEERLELAHPKSSERYKRLKALFQESGCGDLREQPVKGSKEPNLICAAGNGDEKARRIVVGAHFDCAGGRGIIDNWTGAILLTALASWMRQKLRKHSFHFVGFAAEEKGLLGSQAYLKAIPEDERKQIAAVLTMDSLGLTPTKYWPNSSNAALAQAAWELAKAMQLSFQGVNVDNVGSTDSMTFHKAGIPVLSLHSVTKETWGLINSPKDVRESLSWNDYYDTHRLISAILVRLDEGLP